jgi:S-adenosylmethionine hydrolase
MLDHHARSAGSVEPMGATYDTITFLSDRGRGDEMVGVVHSIIRDTAPQATVVDLCHDVEAYDVRAGSLMLARSVPYIAPGVVIASVDPHGSTERRSIAVEIGEGVGVLLGPDNGLLASAVAIVGGAGRCFELSDERYRLPTPGVLSPLRDVLAPAAAHVASGIDISDLGPAIDPSSLLPSLVPVPRFENEQVVAEVLSIDPFGAIQLNVDESIVEHLGGILVLSFGEARRTVRRFETVGAIASGQVGLIPDAHGMLAVTALQRSAAEELGLAVGAEVIIAEAK